MENILQYAVSGLAQGSLYALVALGVVLVYRANRLLNFAHGDIPTVGAFVAFFLMSMGIPWYLAFILAIFVGAAIALIFYVGVLIPAQRREASHLGQIILTLGLGLLLQGIVLQFGLTDSQAFPFPLSDTSVFNFGGVVISHLNMGTIMVGLIGSLTFYLVVQKTRLGLAMRATSENLPAAQTLGIPTRGLLAMTWGLAAALGVLAGVCLAASLLLDPNFMLEPFLKGFAAATLGVLNSLPGAIVGGLVLGVAEALCGGLISVAFKNTMAFIIIILVLVFRPEGLLGKEFIERV